MSSLRGNPRFAALWVSNLFFFGGVWAQTLVLGWLAFEVTGSEFLVAIFTAARLSPLLLGPLAGALADRVNRVRLLAVAAGWAMVATALLAAIQSTSTLPYWGLVLGGFALGLAQSPSQPARASLVMDLVGRENISNANALNALAMNVTQVLGPAIGGAMISALGAAAALWISTCLYVLSLLMLIGLRRLATSGDVHRLATTDQLTPVEPEPGRQGPRGLRRILSGFSVITSNRLAAGTLLVTLAANIMIWPLFQAFMPVFAERQLGLGPAGLSGLLVCSGAGGLIGALVIAALGDFRFKGALFVLGTGLWAALWAAFSLTSHPVPAFVLMAGIGLASSAFGVLQTTLLLLLTPVQVHGRALGLQELAIGIMPVSSLVLGALAEAYGVGPTAFVASVLMLVLLGLLAWRVPGLLRYRGVGES